jgi:hypothetical protein
VTDDERNILVATELGKSKMDLKKSQHAEALHRQLWRYSRDKMSSTTALR